MEATLDEVRKFCGQQLRAYGECIDREGTQWESKCLPEKRAVTNCAAENVPSVRAVKERCSQQVEAYEKCVQSNSQSTSVHGGHEELVRLHTLDIVSL
ncbi:hypothetical protein BC829DRAFT_392728, partial [Chytridium lagenaria]